MAFRNLYSSGSHQRGNLPAMNALISSPLATMPGLRTTNANGRSLHLASGMAIDRSFGYGGMAHDGVFEVDGADPFAAGLD